MVTAPRIFFAAGPGNVIEAHKNWRLGLDDPSQMSITFSSEVEQFCTDIGAFTYIVSSASPAAILKDKDIIVEHRPKQIRKGIRYHINEIRYGLGLLSTALRTKADYAILQSGSMHYFLMAIFRLFGIKIIPVMHNTLWPAGFMPRSLVQKTILFLDSLFFRWFATAILGVSPECVRQVERITRGKHAPVHVFIAQFNRAKFRPQIPPPSYETSPFRLLYSGRITEAKGVLDLLRIIEEVDTRLPGRITLDICGDGPDLAFLKSETQRLNLARIVSIKGWTCPANLRQMLAACNAAIVPTRSDFNEGMAMSAIEPVLMGRPVVTNPVVPALEVLRSACVVAYTDDVESYSTAIVDLLENPSAYYDLVRSCRGLEEIFYDGSYSLQSVLRQVVGELEIGGTGENRSPADPTNPPDDWSRRS